MVEEELKHLKYLLMKKYPKLSFSVYSQGKKKAKKLFGLKYLIMSVTEESQDLSGINVEL